MCTVLRHRHPARTQVDRTQLTRRELTCDGGRHSIGRAELQVPGRAALCLRHHVLGPSVLRRPPRCFVRCDRLRQQALTCTVARPRRRGPVRPWLKRSVSSWRCGGCGQSCGPSERSSTCTGREPLHRWCETPGPLRLAGACTPSLCSSLSRLPPQRLPYCALVTTCLLYTSPSPRDQRGSRMPSSA